LIEHYILLGPLLRPRGWTGSNILFAVSRWFLSSTQRTFSKNSHDKEFLYFVKHSDAMQSQRLPHDWVVALIDYQKRFAHAEISDQSLTIIQGTGDETVDWQYNLPQIEKKFPGSRTYMIAEARHHLANESPEFRDRVFSLIDQIVE
jgi:alpha-beta hydrolase superfamily lysophospholipase